MQTDTKQLEELEPIHFWNAIAAVEQVLCHEGKELHQGDAWIAIIKVRPLRSMDRNAGLCFREELFEVAVVQLWYLYRHGHSIL